MDVKFVSTVPTERNLECAAEFICMKTGRRYWDWMLKTGSVSRRIAMEKALIFYLIYWRWWFKMLKMWCEVESSCYQGSGCIVSSATPDNLWGVLCSYHWPSCRFQGSVIASREYNDIVSIHIMLIWQRPYYTVCGHMCHNVGRLRYQELMTVARCTLWSQRIIRSFHCTNYNLWRLLLKNYSFRGELNRILSGLFQRLWSCVGTMWNIRMKGNSNPQ